MAGPRPSSPEWTRAIYPTALPFMVKHICFDYCHETPDFVLRYPPAPCICVEEGGGVNPLAPRVTAPPTQSARIGQAFSFQIVATNMAAGDTYAATNLPAGLTLNPATGLITGTPTAQTTGLKSVTISATNSEGTGTGQLRINLQAALPVTALTYAGSLTQSNSLGPFTEADVVAAGQHTPNATAGAQITAPYVSGHFGVVFAYPATLPAAAGFVDVQTGIGVTLVASTMSIPQPWPGGAPVSYRVYALHNFGPFASNAPGIRMTIGT